MTANTCSQCSHWYWLADSGNVGRCTVHECAKGASCPACDSFVAKAPVYTHLEPER